MKLPVYYECGICGHCHPWAFNGDCRDDANRFTFTRLDDAHGAGRYIVHTMDERVAADLGHAPQEWSGSPCPDDPDNYWIDDVTGERVKAC